MTNMSIDFVVSLRSFFLNPAPLYPSFRLLYLGSDKLICFRCDGVRSSPGVATTLYNDVRALG